MQIASSANFTCSELRSASLYTATVRLPISRQAEITRSAISPRFAIRTLRNMLCERPSACLLLVRLAALFARADQKQRLSVLHRLAARRDALYDLAGDVALDLVHQLHRFHDAQ